MEELYITRFHKYWVLRSGKDTFMVYQQGRPHVKEIIRNGDGTIYHVWSLGKYSQRMLIDSSRFTLKEGECKEVSLNDL